MNSQANIAAFYNGVIERVCEASKTILQNSNSDVNIAEDLKTVWILDRSTLLIMQKWAARLQNVMDGDAPVYARTAGVMSSAQAYKTHVCTLICRNMS